MLPKINRKNEAEVLYHMKKVQNNLHDGVQQGVTLTNLSPITIEVSGNSLTVTYQDGEVVTYTETS